MFCSVRRLAIVSVLLSAGFFQHSAPCFAVDEQFGIEVIVHALDSPLSGVRAIVHPKTQEVLAFGGQRNVLNDGRPHFEFPTALRCGTRTKSALEWTDAKTKGESPSTRSYGTLVVGNKKRSLYAFGGFDPGFLGDLWELRLGKDLKWRRLHAGDESSPSARDAQVACEDGTGKGMLLFGGLGKSGITNDLWRWSYAGKKWKRLAEEGEWPGPRFTSALAKTDDQTALVVGGFDGQAKPLAELWRLDTKKTAWKRLADLPVKLSAPAAVWHPTLKRLLVFGGSSEAGTATDGIWAYDPKEDKWQKLGRLPGVMAHSTAVYLKATDSVLLIGGTVSHFAASHPKRVVQEVRITSKS